MPIEILAAHGPHGGPAAASWGMTQVCSLAQGREAIGDLPKEPEGLKACGQD
jgi:hypothetical protein